jgi:hypothetical protein
MARAMVDISRGYAPLKGRDLIRGIDGQMEVFPLCCSTGVLKDIRCRKVSDTYDAPTFDNMSSSINLDITSFEGCRFLHEYIRKVSGDRRFVFPEKVARWYAMSLMYQKMKTGKDDSRVGGYNNYKAAQIEFFDRLNEDKSNPAFAFANSYCEVFSCDQLAEWLMEQGGKYGDVLVSPAVPGAHKARVRGCIFTPDVKALKEYHDKRLPIVRDHILRCIQVIKSMPPRGKRKTATPVLAQAAW